MYRIYADGVILHNPMLAQEGRIVIDPILTEALNTHGSLRFSVAPTNPLYDALEERNTKIKVVSDTNVNNKPWFGRVMSIESGWNNTKVVFCEGELGCLNDSIFGPFGFKGSPADLLSDVIYKYNQSDTSGYPLVVGNVSVIDPNNLIVRSSNLPATCWEVLDGKLFGSSLGGYIMPRYDKATDTHYVDYLSLDAEDEYAHTVSQTIKFGKNLLDFSKSASAEDVITVLVPYGAQFKPEDPEYEEEAPEPTGDPGDTIRDWDGNRLTIRSVNDDKNWIENADGVAMWGRIVGWRVWDDVTVAANLKAKGEAWLAQQIWSSISLEISAVDLAFVDGDIEQIQVGDYVRCQSMPHNLNVLLLCTRKETHLTELENSAIILGAGLKTITDLMKQEVDDI